MAFPATGQTLQDLGRMSIEELADVRVTSLAKRPQMLSQAPGSIYVINSRDIRRSGARSLPEVLRLAPNLNVVRLDANRYAISARGFNTYEASNKLLVLIDGRSVYTPLHAGVFWDQQQMMVEDIERIEVISGPGGTLWGSNAVNGVINVITKSSRQTQGGLVSATTGNVDHSGSARYGGKVGENTSYRVYGTTTAFGDSLTPAGGEANDDWKSRQGGFRTDWSSGADALTLQGDIFNNRIETGHISGHNFLARWSRQLGANSSFELQTYYDYAERIIPLVVDRLETFDIEGKHTFRLGENHHIVWGAGYRISREEFDNDLNMFVLRPIEETNRLSNVFLQDSIRLGEAVTLTLGNKFEHSEFGGFEVMPSARMAWQISDHALIWSAVSRAVRSPSRFDYNLQASGFLAPASDFDSEKLIAYEIGIRGQPTRDSSLSLTLFYHDYEDLRILALRDDGLLQFSNRMHGHSYGIETWGDYQVASWWRLSAGLTTLTKNLSLEPGAIPTALDQHQGNDPSYQASLRSAFDLTSEIEFDIALRMVDELKRPAVPSYIALDARLGWRITDSLTLSLAGFNLTDDRHPETGAVLTRREVPRSIYAGATWTF